MPLLVYKIQDYEHTAEREQFRGLSKILKSYYGQRKDVCLFIGNYNMFDSEFDAILIKQDGIICVEFKNYGGQIKAVENGEWTLADGTIIKGGSRKTVYQQAKLNRANLKRGFKDGGILPPKDLKDMGALVVFHQPVIINNQLSSHVQSWLHVTDDDHFLEKVQDITSPQADISRKQMQDLVSKLALEREDLIDEYSNAEFLDEKIEDNEGIVQDNANDGDDVLTISGLTSTAITNISRPMIMGNTYIGIDFGTSTTVVSYAAMDSNNHIHCETLPLSTNMIGGGQETNDLIPTLVACVNGMLCFGPAAKEYKFQLIPDVNLWRSFKMALGEDKGNVYFNSELGADSQFPIQTPKDAARWFFKYLKTRIDAAVERDGLPGDLEYVVSIPASFEANQRKDLLDVLNENGIETDHLSLIDEPNAAFLSYVCETFNSNKELFIPKGKRMNVLVFDYGAGTCDISILGVSKTKDDINSENLAISKFNKCGGDDIDRFIAEHYLYPQLRTENDFRGKSLRRSVESGIYNQLMNVAELLKIQICEDVSLQMKDGQLPPICNSNKDVVCPTGVSFNVDGIGTVSLMQPKLSYFQFNEMMKTFLCQESKKLTTKNDDYNSVFFNIKSALQKARMTKKDIHYVLLIGGSSKNPYLQYALRNYFDTSSILIPRDLQAHVSQGAAIHSFIYHCMGHSIIRPITSEDIIVLLKGNKQKVVVKAGEPIPTPKISIDGLSVDKDGQTKIEIPFCTGNKDKMLMNFCIECPDQVGGYKQGDSVRLDIVISPDKLLQGNAWVNNRRFPIRAINPFANKELTTAEREILRLQKAINDEKSSNGRPKLNAMKDLLRVYAKAEMYLDEAEFSEEINSYYTGEISSNNIAIAYGNAGRPERKIELLKIAINEEPNNPTVLFNYAYNIKSSDCEEYERLMKRSLEINDNDPVHLFDFGEWLCCHGKEEEGRSMIEKSLNIWDRMYLNKRMNSWDYGWMASAKEYVGDYESARTIRANKPSVSESFYDKNNLIKER